MLCDPSLFLSHLVMPSDNTDSRKQREEEIVSEVTGRTFPANHLTHRVKAEQEKGKFKEKLHWPGGGGRMMAPGHW